MAIRDKNYKYKPANFQATVQQILFYLTRGYTRMHVTYYPAKKSKKYNEIDEKIYRKYQTNLTRAQVDYRIKKGYKVYKFLRFENVMILMSNDGEMPDGIEEDDHFVDIKTGQKEVKFSEFLSFIFYIDERKKFTCRVGKQTLNYWRGNISHSAKKKNKKAILQEVRKINFIPPYAGVHKQKKELRKHIISEIEKHGVPFSKDEKESIRFNTRRKQIKVFAD